MSMFSGKTQDISHLRYSFWEPVYYHDPNSKYPDSKILHEWFLGIAESTGDVMTYHIKTQRKDTRSTVIQRSVITLQHPNEAKFGQILSAADHSPIFLFPHYLT